MYDYDKIQQQIVSFLCSKYKSITSADTRLKL